MQANIESVMVKRPALLAAAAGVLWPVLAVSRVFLTGEADRPSWVDAPDAIVDFYADGQYDGRFVAGMAMAMIAYVLLVVFLSRIAEILRQAGTDGATWLGYLIVGGAVLDVALVSGYLATFATATFWTSYGGLSDDGYLALHGLSFSFYWLDLLASALWTASLGVGIVRFGLFPRWLGWALVMNAIGLVAGFFVSSTNVWDVLSGLPYVWVLIAATLLLLRKDQYARAT